MTRKGPVRKLLNDDEWFCILTVVVVIWIYKCNKISLDYLCIKTKCKYMQKLVKSEEGL